VSRSRQLLAAAGVVALAVCAWAWAAGLGLLVAPVLLAAYAALVGLLLAAERATYKRILTSPPGPPWRETSERFVDPASGKLVAVWEDASTGRRAYVACG
jgi:hypothetical protein